MRAIFLDRDGVINRYPGDTKYVSCWKEFRFLPKAKEAVAKLHKNGFRIFITSNQAGVGKGIFSQKALDIITKNMLKEIEKSDGKIDGVYYCTHRNDENCSCRKPKTGLLELVKKNYRLDLKQAIFIGDTIRDVRTAKTAGCKSFLVFSGKEKLANHKSWEIQPDKVFRNLWEAAEFILKNK